MIKEHFVTIELSSGCVNQYIIRDQMGITAGRMHIIDMSEENSTCLLRMKFYKEGIDGYHYLKDALGKILLSFFIGKNMYKVNVLADYDINFGAFMDSGFELEGIMFDNVVNKGVREDELLFGINYDSYKNNNRDRELMLKTRDIHMRMLNPGDAEQVLQYYIRNKEHLRDFEPSRDDSFYTLQVQKRILIDGYKQYLNGNSMSFGIFNNEGFIGKIQVSNIVGGVFRSAFLGYSIDEKHQGKGYMKQAVNALTRYCFDEMGMHRMEASTLVDNYKSQAVLRSCGFKELGLNKSYLFINGKWRDHMTFYLIK